eukprot:3396458-Pleurochrysis_carterae.AAC.3
MSAETHMRLLRHDSGWCASGPSPRASAHIPDLSERGSHTRPLAGRVGIAGAHPAIQALAAPPRREPPPPKLSALPCSTSYHAEASHGKAAAHHPRDVHEKVRS